MTARRGGGLTVAFVNANRKWGGVKTWTLDFGAALAQRGNRVLAVVRPATPFVAACRQAGFGVHPLSFGPKYNPWAIARAVRIFRRERPDVVLVNISKDVEVGAVAARLCRIPVVHRVGLVEDYRGTAEERLRHRWLVDHVLVPASWMADALAERFAWLPREGISAIPNSKDLGLYRARGTAGAGPCTFGTSSQLSAAKGHVQLLEALGRVRAEGLDARLRIAGTGPLEGELRERARPLGEAVEFAGFLTDVPGFLGGLDAFAFPSLHEGFPNALLEAVCAGLPSVASALPGVVEMFGEGTGLLVPPGDVPSLAQGLARLTSDAALRERLGREARLRAEAAYDLHRNAGRLEALLRTVADRGRSRR